MLTEACIELRVQARPSGNVCGMPLEVDYGRKPMGAQGGKRA